MHPSAAIHALVVQRLAKTVTVRVIVLNASRLHNHGEVIVNISALGALFVIKPQAAVLGVFQGFTKNP